MTENAQRALKLLRTYTAGRFDFWILAGPAKASCRAHIASELAGKRVPQSKAGITALRASFYALTPTPLGNCEADREKAFRDWARARTHAVADTPSPSRAGSSSAHSRTALRRRPGSGRLAHL